MPIPWTETPNPILAYPILAQCEPCRSAFLTPDILQQKLDVAYCVNGLEGGVGMNKLDQSKLLGFRLVPQRSVLGAKNGAQKPTGMSVLGAKNGAQKPTGMSVLGAKNGVTKPIG